DESEMRDGLHEPSGVTHDSLAARQPGRMPERRRKRQFPDNSWRKKALPGHGVIHERLEVSAQQFSSNQYLAFVGFDRSNAFGRRNMSKNRAHRCDLRLQKTTSVRWDRVEKCGLGPDR